MTCYNCGKELPEESAFCLACGAKQGETDCVSCGSKLQPGSAMYYLPSAE